jgi:hypothetical protein
MTFEYRHGLRFFCHNVTLWLGSAQIIHVVNGIPARNSFPHLMHLHLVIVDILHIYALAILTLSKDYIALIPAITESIHAAHLWII